MGASLEINEAAQDEEEIPSKVKRGRPAKPVTRTNDMTDTIMKNAGVNKLLNPSRVKELENIVKGIQLDDDYDNMSSDAQFDAPQDDWTDIPSSPLSQDELRGLTGFISSMGGEPAMDKAELQQLQKIEAMNAQASRRSRK